MDWGALLQGIGGGIKGGLQFYQWEEEQARLKERDEALLEVKRMLAELNADKAANAEAGKNARWDRPSGNVIAQQEGMNARAAEHEAGLDERYDRPSGSVIAQITGQNQRHGIDAAFRDKKLEQDLDIFGRRDATTRRGQDIGSADRRYGIDTRDATSRYGIDTRAATAARGQDVTQRGQDLTSGDRRAVAAEATKRAQLRALSPAFTPMDTPAPAGQTPVTPYQPPPAPPPVPPMQAPAPNGAANPTPVTPIRTPAAMKRESAAAAKMGGIPYDPNTHGAPQEPITPPASNPPPQPQGTGTAERMAQLETKVAQVLQQFNAEKDPARKKALAGEIQRLIDQKNQLLTPKR